MTLLHQLRIRRHIGTKSLESPSPEGKREASVVLVGFWQHAAPGHQNYKEFFFQWHTSGCLRIDSPTHTQEDCSESGLGTLKLFAQLIVLLL
eukprot:131944-Pelagomonas_calceolata.AAC.2